VRQKCTEGVGKEYSKSGFRNLRAGLQRHLVNPPYNVQIDLRNDRCFQSANQVFEGKLKLLKKSGLDQSVHKPPIECDDMRKFYESGVLSNSDPVSLQRKVFVEIGLHCGRRGREGWREPQRDSFEKRKDSQGREYITLKFHEFDKNHRNDECKDQRMYARPGDPLCPVISYDLYVSKLNPKCNAFLQRPDPRYEHRDTWYQNAPLGVHTIGNIMKTISAQAGASKTYTNHSLKASTATVLKRAGINTQDIMCITGHKNVASILSYADGPDAEDRARMSDILGCFGKSNVSQMPTYVPSSSVLIDKQSCDLPVMQKNTSSATVSKVSESDSSVTIDVPVEKSVANAASAIFSGANFNGSVTINVQINQ
jgi:hypothetical protein